MISRTQEEFEKTGISVKTNHEVIKVDAKNNTIVIKNQKQEPFLTILTINL